MGGILSGIGPPGWRTFTRRDGGTSRMERLAPGISSWVPHDSHLWAVERETCMKGRWVIGKCPEA
jgi:hypothetical protein